MAAGHPGGLWKGVWIGLMDCWEEMLWVAPASGGSNLASRQIVAARVRLPEIG
jgi:hypothetical protein